MDKMTMQKITLYREGFTPIVIRKVTLVDESCFYEILAYSHPHYLHERWAKIALSNEQVESQIEKYAQQGAERTRCTCDHPRATGGICECGGFV